MLILNSYVWTLLYINRPHFSCVVQAYFKVLVENEYVIYVYTVVAIAQVAQSAANLHV